MVKRQSSKEEPAVYLLARSCPSGPKSSCTSTTPSAPDAARAKPAKGSSPSFAPARLALLARRPSSRSDLAARLPISRSAFLPRCLGSPPNLLRGAASSSKSYGEGAVDGEGCGPFLGGCGNESPQDALRAS